MPISVLYIHHCGSFGGASRSIYELIAGFPENKIIPYMITQKGSSPTFFKKMKIPTIETMGISQFDNTRYSYYRGLRWFILIRELAYLPSTFISLLKAKRKWRNIDIIHINEITNLPVILLCLLIYNKPIVVHVRSVQRNSKNSFRTKFINSVLLNNRIKHIIAIDETVKQSLWENPKISVVHNSFTVDLNGKTDFESTSHFNSSKLFTVGFVGNLLRVKGIFEFIEAAKICSDRKLNVKFLIVGHNPVKKKSLVKFILKKTGIIQDSTDEILFLIEKSGLKNIIEIEDFSSDISKFYSTFSILCFPSHLNAIGRPVIEAALNRMPSIVAIKDPSNDTFINGQTGIAIEEKNPDSLFHAIKYFVDSPNELARMGENAFALAQMNFDPHKNAFKVLDIYKTILIN